MKLKEYLASGKPAVVRDLPANRVWQDALDLAGSAEDFSSLVRQRLEHGLPDDQARARERLEQESWESKAERLRELIKRFNQQRQTAITSELLDIVSGFEALTGPSA